MIGCSGTRLASARGGRDSPLVGDELMFGSSGVSADSLFLTAWDALFARATLRPGATLLVHAAGSGVGTAAIQIARLVGARSIGTARSAAKLEPARALGMGSARRVIPGAASAVLDATFSRRGRRSDQSHRGRGRGGTRARRAARLLARGARRIESRMGVAIARGWPATAPVGVAVPA